MSFFFGNYSIKLFIPIFLPIIDVTYVILLRLKLKENLLERNYLHLYQLLQSKYSGKWYLLTNVANSCFCLALLQIFEWSNVKNEFFLTSSLIFSSIIIYFFIRAIFLGILRDFKGSID